MRPNQFRGDKRAVRSKAERAKGESSPRGREGKKKFPIGKSKAVCSLGLVLGVLLRVPDESAAASQAELLLYRGWLAKFQS